MAVQISGNDITVPRDGSFTRNVTIGGTLTYEDVTNIDSVGLVTARSGIEIGARPGVAASISVDGNMIVSGISTFGGAANFAAISGTTGTFTDNVDIATSIRHIGDTDTKISFDTNIIHLDTNNSERVRITSDGRLLAGTATSKSAGSGQYAKLNIEGGTGTTENFVSFSRAEAASAMSADDEVANLTFNDSAGYEFARIQVLADAATGATDTPGRIVFKTTADGASSSTERLRITSAGTVKISNHGTNDLRSLSVLAPKSQIQFGTTVNVGGFLMSSNNGQFGLSGGAYFSGTSWVATHTGSTQIRTDGDGDISFCSNTSLTSGNTFTPSERVTFNSDGDVTIVDGDLVIGTAGHGIDFSATSDGSGTTSSEVLDEYEEGSFDVNYKTGNAGSNTLSAASYATTGGLYTKIGNMVHFQIRLKCSSHSTIGGQIVIEGLPFTHVSTNVASGAYICASQMLGGSNNARLIISGTQIEFQNLDGTALQSGAGGLNFNNEFHCAGSYIAA